MSGIKQVEKTEIPTKMSSFWIGFWRVGIIAIAKAWPFDIWPSKSPDFQCFQISDHHCYLFFFFSARHWPTMEGNCFRRLEKSTRGPTSCSGKKSAKKLFYFWATVEIWMFGIQMVSGSRFVVKWFGCGMVRLKLVWFMGFWNRF